MRSSVLSLNSQWSSPGYCHTWLADAALLHVCSSLLGFAAGRSRTPMTSDINYNQGGRFSHQEFARFGRSILHGNLIIKWAEVLVVARRGSGASNKRGLTPILESRVFMKSKRSVLRHNPGWGSLGGDLGGPCIHAGEFQHD